MYLQCQPFAGIRVDTTLVVTVDQGARDVFQVLPTSINGSGPGSIIGLVKDRYNSHDCVQLGNGVFTILDLNTENTVTALQLLLPIFCISAPKGHIINMCLVIVRVKRKNGVRQNIPTPPRPLPYVADRVLPATTVDLPPHPKYILICPKTCRRLDMNT